MEQMPIVRGCGVRVKGGFYLECRPSPSGGKPLPYFILDPPVPYNPDVKVGLSLLEHQGVWHVVDWTGETHYPYAADYLEEVRRYGVSSRSPVNLDFSKLERGKSRILAVHPKAIVTNWPDVYPELAESPEECHLFAVSGDKLHLIHPETYCSRHLWCFPKADIAAQSISGGQRYLRRFPRKQTMFQYEVAAPSLLAEPKWAPGIIATFPISHIVAIRDTTQEYQDRVSTVASKLEGTGFDLEEVDF